MEKPGLARAFLQPNGGDMTAAAINIEDYFRFKPYAHQLEEFLTHYDAEYRAMFHQQGLGKTATFIAIATRLYDEAKITGILVLAPPGPHNAPIVLT